MTHRADPYSLRLFVAAAQAGAIVRAAAQEHIAASALSRRLADLEHAFGTPLLVRSPRGIDLTDAGRVVLARGLQIDEDLQALVQDLGRQFAPMVSVSSFDAVCRMVEAGLGIAVVAHSAAAAYAAPFERRPLDEPWAARSLHLYALRRSPQPRIGHGF